MKFSSENPETKVMELGTVNKRATLAMKVTQ